MPGGGNCTSPIRLPVDAMLTVLVFLEWPIFLGETRELFRLCLTVPSEVRLREIAVYSSASGILSRAAASSERWKSWESWLEGPAGALPLLWPLSLPGGVKTRSVSFVAVVDCDSVLESWWGGPWPAVVAVSGDIGGRHKA